MSTAKPKGTVGVIGLGIMGGAFARNLLADGWRVVGHDLDPGRRRALARAGVEMAADAPHLAGEVRTIITSLPSTVALAQTVEAVVDAGARPLVIVETGTFALADKLKAARALAAAGHVMLDCPISGTGAQAKSKDIVVYASGDPKAIKRLRPLFAGFARAAHDLGALGNGSRMKYVANLLVAINNVAAAEAMVLGMKAGLKPQIIYDMVTSGVGNSRIFELRGPMMVRNRYDEATMKVSIWQKDMQVIGEFADALACPTPLFSATRPIYAAALASGHAADDTAAVCAVLEARAGVKRGKRAKTAGTPPSRRKVG
jgi:3-hydroxyisobutyrate dehydrogenase-like beta-hydroxyacid dehydrogenase